MEIIKKSKNDKRIFCGGKLNNNIKYVLIQDETLSKSYVSVAVNIGSYHNTKEYDGLAHFLEHMLFMGSKKYPYENHFYNILTKYGGISNAYTSEDNTVYFFNVFDSGLLELIDIFSRFFIDPLFNSKSLEKEINAVQSEYEKNLNNDNYTIYQFIHYLMNNDSTINNFFCGNLNTLNKTNIRDIMIDFYNNYYTSDNISICIMSCKPITELYNIINNTFNTIPTKINNKVKISKPLFINNINKTYHIKSISNIYKLIYLWEIPEFSPYNNDFNIFGNILSNISKTSLYYHLKNKGYLTNINIDILDIGVFIIELTLTEQGYNNLIYIEYILFYSINQIINSNIELYAKYYKKISLINYKLLSKEDPEDLCNLLSTNHFKYKTVDLYKSIYILKITKSTNEYKTLYKKYINTNNFIRILISNNYINKKKLYYQVKEYINNSYSILNNYKSIINKIFINNFNFNDKYLTIINKYNNNINNLCCFTPNNIFLDIQIKLNKNLDLYKIPTLIDKNIWYGGISKFNEPIVNINILLTDNNFFINCKNYLLTTISCIIVNNIISSDLFNAKDIGYNISFNPIHHLSLINIIISGANDIHKIKIIINYIFNFINNINNKKISKLYINNLLLTLKINYNNISFLNSWNLTNIIIDNHIYPTSYNVNLLLKTLETINYDIIKNYIIKFLNNININCLFYGNIYKNDVLDILNKYKTLFNNNKYKLLKYNKINNIFIKHPNINEKLNCISYYYLVNTNTKNFSPYYYIIIKLFILIFNQLFFDELRTKHQLGYLVQLTFINYRYDYYIIEKVQSLKNIKLVKSFINNFNNELLNNLNENNFNDAKITLKNILLEPYNSLSDMYMFYANEIINQYFIFNRKELLLSELINITINDIIKFINNTINKNNIKKIIIKGN